MVLPGVESGTFSISERRATNYATEDADISYIDILDKL